MENATSHSLASRAWDSFSKLNVNEFTERKGNLTYLSWPHAYAAMMSVFPESSFDIDEPVRFEDGSVEVRVSVTICDGDDRLTKSMWLPVMDHKNNAIINPDARKISDAKMRCLVKCLSLFGLGLYIYAGEELPISGASDTEDDEGAGTERLPEPPPKTVSALESKLRSGAGSANQAVEFLCTRYTVSDDLIRRLQAAEHDGREVAA